VADLRIEAEMARRICNEVKDKNATLTREKVHTHCNTLQHRAASCNTIHHRNTLQLPATHSKEVKDKNATLTREKVRTHCNKLKHPATPCNILQHPARTATHCNTQQYTTMKSRTRTRH